MNEFDRLSTKRNEAKEKKKKMLLTGIIICIIVIIMLAVMIMYYQSVDAHTFKLFVNDTQTQVSDGFYFKSEQGETYVRAKDIANFIGWSYQNGEYGSFTEDTNSGYIQNDYEIASFVAGSNVLKKYIQVTATPYQNELGEEVEPYVANSANGTLETATLSLPVISQNGQIYFPLKNLCDICNCRVIYENEFRMYVYEQNFLINLAQVKAAEFGYKSVSGIYENMRILGYGMMCVSNGTMYGVVNIDNGSNVIGLKYNDMIFAQNTKEFFVKITVGDEESIGIININGGTVVQPKNYDSIQILSDDLGLYLVGKDGDFGVLDKSGEVVVHSEYESIGIPEDVLTSFKFSVEDNKYLLFDNTIIVSNDGKYGACDLKGKETLPTDFEGFGYIAENDEEKPRNAEDLLTFEYKDLELSDGTTRDVQGLVLKEENEDGNVKYGIYDAVSGRQIIPCSCDRIYTIRNNGEAKYYYEYEGQTGELSQTLIQNPDSYFN